LILLFSCQKQTINPPGIELISPHQFHNIASGEVFLVDVNIWDEQEVDSYVITLTSASGFEYFQDEKNIHLPFYHISYEFDMSTTKEQDFNITIQVEDNDGNISKRSIGVTIDN
jgi:hypothetical protein|tara:strand:- start:1585 stop:1926 length:342 start_codon:yes stop_codon:yes gene_type:complete